MPNPNIPALPASGSTAWYTHYTAIDAQTRLAGGPRVPLDSFAGANDSAKLSAAMSYAGAQTFAPIIELANRSYAFTTALGQPYAGFSMVGGNTGWPNREQNSPNTTVTVTANGPWLSVATLQYDWTFVGIEFVGGGTNTQFLSAPSSTAAMWKFYGQDLGFQNFKGVFGNSSEVCFIDLCTFTGAWSMLSPLDTQVNIGGADCLDLWTSGSLNIGGGSTGPVAGAGGNRFLMMFSGLSKSNLGNIYLTADNGWRGALFKGSQASGYGLGVQGCVFEGRNPGDPCHANLVRVEGGAVEFNRINVNSGMTAPTGTSANNPNAINDRALFEVVGGANSQVGITGMTVSHATGVATTMPVIYADTGTRVHARNVWRSTRSGSPAWGSQMPVAKQPASGPIAETDSSVAVVTGP